jgi:hypothetical protein
MRRVRAISLPDIPLPSSSSTSLAFIFFAIRITSFPCLDGETRQV